MHRGLLHQHWVFSSLGILAAAIQISIKTPFAILSTVLSSTLRMAGYLIVWSAIYTGKDPISSYEMADLTSHYLLATCFSLALHPEVTLRIRDEIRHGELALYLSWPVSPIWKWFLLAVGSRLLPTSGIVIALVSVVKVFGIEFHISLTLGYAIAAVLAIANAFIFNFCLELLIAFNAFWQAGTGSIYLLNRYVVGLLSGAIVPIGLFPGILQSVFRLIPFPYFMYFPIELIRAPDPIMVIQGLLGQVIWLIITIAGTVWVWRLSLRSSYVPGI